MDKWKGNWRLGNSWTVVHFTHKQEITYDKLSSIDEVGIVYNSIKNVRIKYAAKTANKMASAHSRPYCEEGVFLLRKLHLFHGRPHLLTAPNKGVGPTQKAPHHCAPKGILTVAITNFSNKVSV